MIQETNINKALPASPEAEIVIEGAILLDNTLMAQAAEVLTAADFDNTFRSRVFSAMIRLFERGERIEPILLGEELRRMGFSLDAMGGVAAISKLIFGLPHFSSIREQIAVVLDKSNKRKLARKLSAAVAKLVDDDASFAEILHETEGDVFSFSAQGSSQNFEPIHQVAERSIEPVRECVRTDTTIEPVRTGFSDLDDMLGTLEPELIILGARPSIGKTSLAINIAEDFVFNQRKTVAFFTLEMSAKALTNRIICSRAEVPFKRYKLGNITAGELDRIERERIDFELTEGNFFINDQSDITPLQMMSKCRALRVERGRLDLVIIDYLQMMNPSKVAKDLRERVTEVSKELAQVKKELNVPVIAVASLSRASETGTVRKPRASDLRESGQIESDADQIWMLHREGFYNPHCAAPSIANLEIVKSRNGETGDVELLFQKEFTRFKNLARY